MSEHQIIYQNQSREQELHQRKALVNYSHFPLENQHLENQHLEVNINQHMVILNRNTSLKENEVGREVLKDHLLLKRITQNMTPKRMIIEPEHIGEKQKEDIQ